METTLRRGIELEKLKIAIIDPNPIGGHNQYCHSLSRILSDNHDVVYINREEKIKNNISYRHIAMGNNKNTQIFKIKSYTKMYLNIRKYLNKNYILHFQAINYYMLFLIVILRLSTAKPVKAFFTLHNLQPHSFSLKEKVNYGLLKCLLSSKFFRRIIYHYEFYSNNSKTTSTNITKKITQKMHFIPHHMFDKNMYENSKNVNNGKINILLFGVIRDNKGILEFFNLLFRKNIKTDQINFIIAGKFIDYSENDILQITNKLSSPISIKIFNNFIQEEDKSNLFLQAHYILLPYKKSFLAQSGIVLDAYKYKIPLIVSENTSLKYLVEKESTGLVINSEKFMNIFEKDLFNQSTYLQLIENIQIVLESKYTDIAIKNKYYSLYSKE